MTSKIITLLIFTILIWQIACVHKKTRQIRIGKKVRPQNVPATAVLINGFEYGQWVDCTIKNQKQNRYVCRAYDDREGLLIMSGEYVLIERKESLENRNIETHIAELITASFGGILKGHEHEIRLAPNGIVDYPHGKIYPEGDNRRMKQLYKLGQALGKEIYY